MDRIFMFDIDGTLTPSRLRMVEEFAKFFDKWSNKNKYYLVTGSDLDKTKEQLPIAYIDRAEAIFTCCGNQMWRDSELIYDNKFELTSILWVEIVHKNKEKIFINGIMKQVKEKKLVCL